MDYSIIMEMVDSVCLTGPWWLHCGLKALWRTVHGSSPYLSPYSCLLTVSLLQSQINMRTLSDTFSRGSILSRGVIMCDYIEQSRRWKNLKPRGLHKKSMSLKCWHGSGQSGWDRVCLYLFVALFRETRVNVAQVQSDHRGAGRRE